MNPTSLRIVVLAALSLIAGAAFAQVKIGVVVSATGPAASLGIPEKNTIVMCPKSIGGKSVEYLVLDDATDTTNAVQATKKLIGESQVDAIIGTTTTPATLAMLDVIADGETPTISLASSIRIIDPVDAKRAWMFKTPQTDVMMAGAILEHAAAAGVKTLGYVGFSDALGEAFFVEIEKAAAARGIPLVANERFAPKDTSVVGQALKLIAAKPDAVVIGASGTPAALPASTLTERGYKGRLYFNHGVANNDFLRVGGKDVEGAFVVSGPAVVAEQLAAGNPSKAVALDYVQSYEKAYGPASRNQFAAHGFDVAVLLQKAVPIALKSAKPGTPEFRVALRNALETMGRTVVSQGVLTYTKDDHWGFQPETGVMLKVVNGDWKVE
jgi:branched-chain amino acid transport system substrate-binding protein